jgi:geranylgeranyl pyrophosphate synthase
MLSTEPLETGAAVEAEDRAEPAAALLTERLLSAAALAQLAPAAAGVPAALWRQALVAPVMEILGRPGKGFRGSLTRIAFRLAGGAGEPPPALAGIFEILHAGSMIVDDIEDDSSERRGAPAVHRLHGLPLALNAGNWMYFAPFGLLGELDLPPAAELGLCRRLGETLLQCHFGQALDLGARLATIPQRRVPEVAATISALKTGRLLAFAAEAGAACAGGAPAVVAAVSELGGALGVGLQMLDDLGNLSPGAAPGKRLEDLRQGRVTWPWAWAAQRLDGAAFGELVRQSDRLSAQARLSIAGLPGPDRFEPLAASLRALVERPGRRAAQRQLEAGLGTARARLGPAAVGPLEQLAREVRRLEVSYG